MCWLIFPGHDRVFPGIFHYCWLETLEIKSSDCKPWPLPGVFISRWWHDMMMWLYLHRTWVWFFYIQHYSVTNFSQMTNFKPLCEISKWIFHSNSSTLKISLWWYQSNLNSQFYAFKLNLGYCLHRKVRIWQIKHSNKESEIFCGPKIYK